MGSQFKNRFRPQVESLDERCLPSTSPILTVPHAQPLTGYSAPSNRAYYAAANQGDRWTIIRQDPDYPKTYTDPTSASARADARQDSILFPRATIYAKQRIHMED